MNNQRAFQLPKDGLTYIGVVQQRCEDMINAKIWDGLHITRLRRWLANFREDTERYFAAGVLDALIYRSRDQTVALMRQLFERVLPDQLRRKPPSVGPRADWRELLHEEDPSRDPGIRVVPVIRDADPPTKSGPLVARMYRRHLGVSQNWMIWPWRVQAAVDEGVKAFLFIDDFLGTGDQFEEFCRQFGLPQLLSNVYGVYAPLVAHEAGLARVASSVPQMHLVPVEILSDSYGLFSPTSNCFADETNSPEAAGAFYEEVLKRRNIILGQHIRHGYGRMELAYSFEHATPDNCLPILWMKVPQWEPLFDR